MTRLAPPSTVTPYSESSQTFDGQLPRIVNPVMVTFIEFGPPPGPQTSTSAWLGSLPPSMSHGVRVLGGLMGPDDGHCAVRLKGDRLLDTELIVVGARAHLDDVTSAGRGQRAGDGGIAGVGAARARRTPHGYRVGHPPGGHDVDADGRRRGVTLRVARGAAGACPERREMMHAHRRSR